MNKLKFTLALLAFGALSTAGFAQHRTKSEARAIAQEKASELGVTMSSTSTARKANSTTTSDEEPYYIFNNGNDKGFTIVSGDERLPEVIGYSDNGTIDVNNMAPGLQYILGKVTKAYNSLDSLDETGASTSSTTSANKVIRKATANTTNKAIGPLCVTDWSQYEPYYNLTPTSSGSQTLTCCVATALAQILYYLYYTQDGQESTSFSNSVSYNGTTISNRSYDWSLMLPHYLGEYTDAQAEAVAKLMRDVGYALNVTYGTDESTAYQTGVPNVASTYFGLATATSTTGYSSATTLFKAIDTELNNYRPVQVCGNGHSFLCDGRAADGIYYHFNFGYGGGNGFYSTDGYLSYDASDMETVTGFRLNSSSSTVTTTTGLTVAYKSAVRTLGLRPVGTVPGMYQVSYYNTLKGYLDTAKGVIDGTTTVSDVATLINNIGTAVQNMVKYTTPFDSNGFNTTGHSTSAANANGTAYRIQTYKQLAGKYGQIGWYFDNDDGYYDGDDPLLNVYGIADSYNGSKFRFIYDSSTNGYYIGNNSLDFYLMGLPDTGYGQDPEFCVYGYDGTSTYHNTDPTTENDDGDTPVPCEVVPVSYLGDGTFAVTLRPMADGYLGNPDFFLDCWEENSSSSFVAGSYSSSSNSFKVNGGDAYGEYYGRWTLVPVYGTSTTSTTPTATFSNSSVEISQGSTATQTVTTNSKGTVTYSSSDISIASVDPTTGEVTGVGAGTATITAAIGCTTTYSTSGYAAAVATYTVTVTSSGPATPTITFANQEFGVEVGKTATNTLTTNSDATPYYTSSNTSIATVNSSTGAVTGVKKGSATITVSLPATSNYIAGTATYTVNVTNTLPTFNVETSALDLTIGETETRTATTNSTGSVTYTSSNTSVATVDSKGKVTAVGTGTATITVSVAETSTYASVTSTYTVTVTKKDQTISFADASESIMVDNTVTNVATVTTGDGAVSYSSSNEAIATVDAATGEVTGTGIGTATITATAAETTNYAEATATYTVTVTKNTTYEAAMDELLSTQSSMYTDEELAAAKKAGTTTQTISDGLITASSQFSSPYTESSEGSFDYLLDNDQSTFWHSKWSGGSVSAGTHYFIVTLNEAESDSILLSMGRRSNATDDHPTQFEVYGSNDNSTWTDICTLSTPFASKTETVTARLGLGASYTYLKFVCTNTGSTSSSFSCRGYFHMGEFQLYRITTTTTPADENSAKIIALDAAYTKYAASNKTKSDVDELRAIIETYVPEGDVNLDGKVDIADITWLIHYLKGNTSIKHGVTDVNHDYKTNVNDIDTKVIEESLKTSVLNK